MMQMSDSDFAVKSVTKLLLSAEHYASISPALARHCMIAAERLKKKLRLPLSDATQMCPYCYVMRRPDNCRYRLLSKMTSNRHIQRSRRKIAGGRTVGKFTQSLLELHLHGANRIQICCRGCGKRAIVGGASRTAKSLRASDLSATGKSPEQMPTKKKKKNRRKRKPTVDFNSKPTSTVSVGAQMEQKIVTNRKETSAKSSRALDLSATGKSPEQVLTMKNKKNRRKRKPTADSNSKPTSTVSVGAQMEQKIVTNPIETSVKTWTPSHFKDKHKCKVTNKKATLKQKHSMLQNILNLKTSAASPDTSAALKTFLMSL